MKDSYLHSNQCSPIKALELQLQVSKTDLNLKLSLTVIAFSGYGLPTNKACCFVTNASTPEVFDGTAALILDSMLNWILRSGSAQAANSKTSASVEIFVPGYES